MQTKAGRNAVGQRTVAVSRDDLQLVATRDEMVVLRAGVKAGIVARTVGIQTRNVERLLILRIIECSRHLPQRQTGGFRKEQPHRSQDQRQQQIHTGNKMLPNYSITMEFYH